MKTEVKKSRSKKNTGVVLGSKVISSSKASSRSINEQIISLGEKTYKMSMAAVMMDLKPTSDK
jgi:hypothetical protein